MSHFRLITIPVVLLLGADVSGVIQSPVFTKPVHFSPDESLPGIQQILQSGDQTQPAEPESGKTDLPAKSDHPPVAQNGPMRAETRLELVRYVDGEFARVVQPIPAGKNGFHLKAGASMDPKTIHMAVASHGAAINPGDQAQITNLEFKARQIVFEINGGGRGHTRLRDRIHLEVGGMSTARTTQREGPVNTNLGATLYLDFDKPLPDMTPDELKQYLSGFLDFSKQHSAAIQWVETLPPEVQKAIADKRPAVGMDHEMVLAAVGRPDRKVREKGPDGNEVEDWIYGKPPAKTVFVVFEGDKVTKVQQFPQ